MLCFQAPGPPVRVENDGEIGVGRRLSERSEESPKEKGPNNAGENRGSQLQNPGKTVLAFLRFFLELMIQDVRLKYV